jgi:ATP-dependent protease ClpP protease subunit
MKPEYTQLLLEKRQILLQGVLDATKQEHICSSILYLNAVDDKLPITLFIDCMGGSSSLGGYVRDSICASLAPINGVVIGMCGSAAFDILQVCHTRIAYKNSHLLFHSTQVNEVKINRNRKKLIDFLDGLRLSDERVIKHLARRSGQSLRQIRKWAEQEVKFTAVQAFELGFVDKIKAHTPTPH